MTFFKWLLAFFSPRKALVPIIEPVVAPPPPHPQPKPVQVEEVKYHWDTPVLARHSIRVLCDEMGMSVDDKNIFCATMGAESGWKSIRSLKPNFDGTYDWGICQINTKYWIGEGKTFPSTDYVLSHPEACVRWAIKQWMAGHRNYWYGYSSGHFAKFL